MSELHLSAEVVERLREMIRDELKPFADRVERHEIQLNGKDGEFGIAQEVRVLWRSHVWVLCTLSAGAGSALTGVILHFLK